MNNTKYNIIFYISCKIETDFDGICTAAGSMTVVLDYNCSSSKLLDYCLMINKQKLSIKP